MLFRKPKKQTNRQVVMAIILATIVVTASVTSLVVYWATWNQAFKNGQTDTWDFISTTEKYLRDLHSEAIQTKLRGWLPNNQMNFTDGPIWESNVLEYNRSRPKYENVTQALANGKGACGEFVWVFAAFCVANRIPVRVVTLGYFDPNVIDHSWAQVNPSNDGKTWIHVEVTDTCVRLQKGLTINDLWNVTINNNTYYIDAHYQMVLALQLNQDQEIVITDVTATFSSD